MNKGTAIFITGPTASGKTSTSIRVARQLHTEIISADSRQLYKELDIGVARPSAFELDQVRHHFIASHSIYHPISTYEYEVEALACIDRILDHRQYVVVSGGTGMYLKAILEGLDDIPAITQEVEEQVLRDYEENGLEWLQKEVAARDSEFYLSADQKNPRRLQRALAVIRQTGKPFSMYWNNEKSPRPFKSHLFSLNWNREDLYDRINQRVDSMFEQGLLEEVKRLKNDLHLRALQTVGYKEFIPFFEGQVDVGEVIEKIKQHSRNYAKRQETWIKNQLKPIYVSPESATQEILQHINTPPK